MKKLLRNLALFSTLLFCANAIPQVVGSNYIGPPFTYQSSDVYGEVLSKLTFNSIGEAQNQWLADFSTAPPGCTYYTVTGTPLPGYLEYQTWFLLTSSACPAPKSEELYGATLFVSLYFEVDPGKNNGCAGNCAIGDPINLTTGNESEEIKDYSSDDLVFVRSYNSNPAAITGHIGAHWTTNYNLMVSGSSATDVVVTRADGKYYHFSKINGVWVSDSNVSDVLTELDDSEGNVIGWKYYDAGTLNTEAYDANGKLVSIDMRNGRSVNLIYNNGLLVGITNAKGRSLSLSYDSSSRIHSLTIPSGGEFIYSYDPTGTLHSVQNPDGTIITYLYDESANVTPNKVVVQQYADDYPYLLTGVIDENNVRYSNITYDGDDRATSSQMGGIANTVSVSYGSDDTSTVVYNGQLQSSYGFSALNGKYNITAASANCLKACGNPWKSQTYDSNGYPAANVDFDGNTTAYTYDIHGLETQRIEARGTPFQRTINTQWDDALRNPLERTTLDANGVLTAKTDWLYNSRGQMLARCEDDVTLYSSANYACSNTGTPPAGVRRWTYTYCDAANDTQCPLIGLLLSVDGPRTDLSDVTQYSYYLTTDESGCATAGGTCHHLGDLATVTDALGHVTTTISYDKDGRPTEVEDPNGVLTDFSYTPRGWLRTRSIAGATTTIDYDAVGNVIKVTQPDGVFTSYTYDDAHRLISIADALGNHVDYTLDAAGNRTAENTYAVGSASVRRTLTRQFNTLGQLVKELDA